MPGKYTTCPPPLKQSPSTERTAHRTIVNVRPAIDETPIHNDDKRKLNPSHTTVEITGQIDVKPNATPAPHDRDLRMINALPFAITGAGMVLSLSAVVINEPPNAEILYGAHALWIFSCCYGVALKLRGY